MQKVWFAGCAALFVVAVGLAAQPASDLSGTWVLDPVKGGAQARGTASTMSGRGGSVSFAGAGGPAELRITQTDTSLTIERTAGSTTQKHVHTFDRAENVNVNGRATLRTKSHWSGSQLVTEGTQVVATNSGDVTASVREARSLGADGALIVEVTRTVEGATSTTTQRFVRKK